MAALLLASCWSPSTLKTPETLGPGESCMGMGFSIHSWRDLKTGAVAFDYYFRRYLAPNTDFGLKFAGVPLVAGTLYGDVKHRFVKGRINLTGDLEVFYYTDNPIPTHSDVWGYGMAPMLIAGTDALYCGFKVAALVPNINPRRLRLDLQLSPPYFYYTLTLGGKVGHRWIFHPEIDLLSIMKKRLVFVSVGIELFRSIR